MTSLIQEWLDKHAPRIDGGTWRICRDQFGLNKIEFACVVQPDHRVYSGGYVMPDEGIMGMTKNGQDNAILSMLNVPKWELSGDGKAKLAKMCEDVLRSYVRCRIDDGLSGNV